MIYIYFLQTWCKLKTCKQNSKSVQAYSKYHGKTMHSVVHKTNCFLVLVLGVNDLDQPWQISSRSRLNAHNQTYHRRDCSNRKMIGILVLCLGVLAGCYGSSSHPEECGKIQRLKVKTQWSQAFFHSEGREAMGEEIWTM